ncbi:DNA repair protein RadC [Pseudomonas sp. GOM7]|uniref:RadC family protein n=1 Tax=Pseudomonas sp. GOM7 TaxID=2998079 RepID=UPI00227A3292|nr:DNA repair protein RadC [Pseudomonas sp. GOM7]WAJ37284.1 DNA repair protein RadC [Pseudomonas sp. GOM7]
MQQLRLIESCDRAASKLADEDLTIGQAIQILERRLFSRGPELTSPEAVRNYLRIKLAPMENEVFGAVFLDTKHRTLAFEILFQGGIESANVYPREVVKRALAHNAAAMILTHNHPSGCSTPSEADRVLTQRLKEALALVQVRVLDHLIVGQGAPLSMAELGWV